MSKNEQKLLYDMEAFNNNVDFDSDKAQETHCGITAVRVNGNFATRAVKKSLEALQPRGRDFAGLVAQLPSGEHMLHTGRGLVVHVLNDELLDAIGPCSAAIGHNRYPTSGSKASNMQPNKLEENGYVLSQGHNGNLFDLSWYYKLGLPELDPEINDSYLLISMLMHLRQKHGNWRDTFIEGLTIVQNAGTVNQVSMTEDGTIFASRDPSENRMLALGRYEGEVNGWIVASEEAAISIAGASFVREVKGGELIEITPDGKLQSFFYGRVRMKDRCTFEKIYLARPDSFIDGQRVEDSRSYAGRLIGKRMKEKGIQPSIVIPVLQSGYDSSVGLAFELGLPLVTAIKTDLYKGRTFILPDQHTRKTAVNEKHHVVPDKVIGENVVIEDDSGIRFNTSKEIVRQMREAGARTVHVAFASPPVREECDIGIDMKQKELPAASWSEDIDELERQAAAYIGADTVTFLPIAQTLKSMGESGSDYCTHCFDGDHPFRNYIDQLPRKERQLRGKPKIMTLASGGGTNFEKMINGVEQGYIDAELVGLISNNPEAYALERAEYHGVLAEMILSAGKLKDPKKRRKYLQQVAQRVECSDADLLVLAGWMVVLDDEFLQKMQELEIPVLNLHPALLSENDDSMVMTSRGRVPVIRGAHAIRDAYDQNPYSMQVSGVTVHQLLPGNGYDVGPIVLKEEVRRHPGETLNEWEQRIHQTEYRVLPTAINYVLHAMKAGVDTSKGGYRW